MEKKKILVTGATGFLGKNLIQSLLIKKTKLFVFVRNKSSFIKTLTSKEQKNNITIIEGDITDFKKISRLINSFSIQHIFHLAANNENRVLKSSPFQIINTNLIGSLSVMEASLNNDSIKTITMISSKEVDRKNSQSLHKNITHPYATSKYCTEILAKSYIDNYKLPIIVLKFDNIFGEGDLNFNRLIPNITKKLIQNKSINFKNKNNIFRGFIYIDDIIEILEEGIINYTNIHSKNIITINSSELISIREVANRIAEILGKKEIDFRVKEKIKKNKSEKNIYNWKPKTKFNDGLRKTVNWYKDYLKF